MGSPSGPLPLQHGGDPGRARSPPRHHRIGGGRTHESTRRLGRPIRLGRARVPAAVGRVGERWWSSGSRSSDPRGAPRRAPMGSPGRLRGEPPNVAVPIRPRWSGGGGGAPVGDRGRARGGHRARAQPGPATTRPDRTAPALAEPAGLGPPPAKGTAPARLQTHLAAIRRHEIHRLITTRGRIAVEGLDVTGMLRRRGRRGSPTPPWPRSGGSCATGPAGDPIGTGSDGVPLGGLGAGGGRAVPPQLQEGSSLRWHPGHRPGERWACDGGGSAASAVATRRSTWRGPRPGGRRSGSAGGGRGRRVVACKRSEPGWSRCV